jgi:hypothetical protein
MEEDRLFEVLRQSCDHTKEKHYTQKQYDILNGYELILTKCINCHKTLALEAKKFGPPKKEA